MPWYTAHLVTYFKLKNAPQDLYTVWENIVLIEAVNEAEAIVKATEFGKLYEAEDESLTADDEPAETVFAGVRKIGSVCHIGNDGKLNSGDEMTFNWFELPDKQSISKLVEGEEVTVKVY
jgi:hypothetical protein